MVGNEQKSFVVIGAGLLGIQVARYLKQLAPDSLVHVIEKNSSPFLETSSRHSSMVHHPAYYKDSELKKLVAKSREKIFEFCRSKEVPFQIIDGLFQGESEVFRCDIPIVSLHDFNQALYQDSLELGVIYSFNTAFTKKTLSSSDILINCAGVGALALAQEYDLGHEYFQLNFEQFHFIDPHLNLDHHRFEYSINESHEEIPMARAHWVLSPFEGLVKYGPFLRPKRLQDFLIRPLDTLSALIILSSKFGATRVFQGIFSRRKQGLPYYPKRPTRSLIFDREALDLLTKPLILTASNWRSLHIINYQSPGFTISFAMAENIAKSAIYLTKRTFSESLRG